MSWHQVVKVAKVIGAVLTAAAALVQGGVNLFEHLYPTKVSAPECGKVIESLSVSLSQCLGRGCR